MKNRILNDRTFHKLVDEVKHYQSEQEYISSLIRNKLFNYKEIGLNYEEATQLLKIIYTNINKSLKTIMKECKCTKSEVSHIYCIPIRTIEDWYIEKNRCPNYIKILILKQFHKFKLGNYIKLQSDITHDETKEKTYITSEKCKPQKLNKNNPIEKEIEKPERIYAPQNWYDYHLPQNIKGRSTKTKQLLEDTAYIDQLIKRRKMRQDTTE